MMRHRIILLLQASLGEKLIGSGYEIASLQLSGWIDDEGMITPEGVVVVGEIQAYIERII